VYFNFYKDLLEVNKTNESLCNFVLKLCSKTIVISVIHEILVPQRRTWFAKSNGKNKNL